MKFKLITILIVCSFVFPELNSSLPHYLILKNKLFKKHAWLNNKLYKLYQDRSRNYMVPIDLATSVVNAESNGRNVISRANNNGSRDYGRFQVNSIHLPSSPRKLLCDKINSKFGFMYLSLCLKKSKNNISETIRMYNQGLNGNKKYYKNWKYVEKVLICYN